jgi:hypothetical protein
MVYAVHEMERKVPAMVVLRPTSSGNLFVRGKSWAQWRLEGQFHVRKAGAGGLDACIGAMGQPVCGMDRELVP